MQPTHLHLFLEKIFSGCQFQKIFFLETGDVEVTFFDAGGNWHWQMWNADGTVGTVSK
jgi:hypothetical protein